MKKSSVILLAVSLLGSLFAIVGVIMYMSRSRIITPEMALLLLVALLGFYIGFAVLIMVYRFVRGLR